MTQHPVRCHPHRFYDQLVAQLVGECPVLDPAPGAAVVTVGSGLLMATVDALVEAGVPVHCAVDVGRLEHWQKAQLVDWAAWSDGHTCVVVHAWHSRSRASDFAAFLAAAYPELLAGRTPVPVVFRLRGLGEDQLPAALPNQWDWDDLVRAAAAHHSAMCDICDTWTGSPDRRDG